MILPPGNPARPYFYSLEILRGLCPPVVLVYHTLACIGPNPDLARATETMFALAIDAIMIFFFISGFVVANSLQYYRVRFGDARGAAVFMGARALRIWPLTALVSIAAFAAIEGYRVFAQHDLQLVYFNDPARLAASMLGYGAEWTRSGWTLFYELWAYATLPFLVCAVAAPGPARKSAWLAAAIVVFSLHLFGPVDSRMALCLLAAFSLGVLLFHDPRLRLKLPPVAGFVALPALVAISVWRPDMAFALPLRWALCAAIVLTALAQEQKIRAHLAAQPVRALLALGASSYSLYLWHMPVFMAVIVWLFHDRQAAGWAQAAWFVAVAWPLTFAITGLSARYIEKRLRMAAFLPS